MKPFVLIAIPFKNKSDLVTQCIDSLLNKSYVSGMAYTIILINDGSEYKEVEKVRLKYGNIAYIINYDSVGYTKIVYDMVDLAKKEKQFNYLLISNNDIKFFPSTLYSLVSRMNSNPNIANVGCKILHWTKDVIIHTGTRINKKCENWVENPYCGLSPDDPIANVTERRLWTNGACSLYNLDILRKENMNFDLSFSPAYFEESDLHTRLNIKDYSVTYEPRAIVRHKVNATVSDYLEMYNPVFSKNWELYLSKWKKYFDSKMLYFQS